MFEGRWEDDRAIEHGMASRTGSALTQILLAHGQQQAGDAIVRLLANLALFGVGVFALGISGSRYLPSARRFLGTGAFGFAASQVLVGIRMYQLSVVRLVQPGIDHDHSWLGEMLWSGAVSVERRLPLFGMLPGGVVMLFAWVVALVVWSALMGDAPAKTRDGHLLGRL